MFNDIDIVRWDITRKCNLKCKHCYADHLNRGVYNELDLNDIKKIASTLLNNRVARVGILGGEPFIRKDILDIFSYFSNIGLRASVTTNGTLFNYHKIRKICDFKEPSSITFTFLGHNSITHDYVYGQESFIKLIETIKLFRQCIDNNGINKQLFANLILTQKNIKYLIEACKLIEDLGFETIQIEDIAWVGKAVNYYEELYVPPADLFTALQNCLENKLSGKITSNLNFLCLPPLVRDYLSSSCNTKLPIGFYGCPLPNEFYVSSEGVLYPCQQIHEMEARNINWIVDVKQNNLLNESLADIINSSCFNKEYIMVNQRPYKEVFPCSSCKYVNTLCRPCIRHAYTKTLHPFEMCEYVQRKCGETN